MNSSINSPRIFDYFVICGLDSVHGLVPNGLLDEQNARVGPFDASFTPQVLEHYPDEVSWNPFDSSAVATLCMPRGVHFSWTPSESPNILKEPNFHPFVITKENGAKVYGFSLIFYERVQDGSIIDAVASLQKMHSAQVTVPHLVEKRMDLSPAFDSETDILLVSKSITLTGQYPFVEAARSFLVNFYRFAVHSSHVSSPPSQSSSASLSLESFVYYVLFSIPLPSPNQCIVIPNVPSVGWRHSASNVLILQRPASSVELPLFEYDIGKVVELLGVDGLIKLWTCLLLESQILICSADYGRLMLVAESLTALLFPFAWPHVYVPILPPAMYNFLDAPVPYLMGLSSLPADDCRLPSEANLCMVDVDHGTIDVPEELPMFPQHKELAEELKDVLKKLQSTEIINNSKQNRQTWSPLALSSGTNDNAPAVLERSEAYQRVAAIAKRTGVICDEGHAFHLDLENSGLVNSDVERYLRVQRVNNAVREIFLNQFTHVFAVYEHFVIQPNQDLESWLSNREMVHTFDKTTFLSDQPAPHLPFLSRFLESQMFATFIDSKVLANFGQSSQAVRVLDARIKLLKDGFGENGSMVRTPGYERCTWFADTAALLERRILKPSLNVVTPFEVLDGHQGDKGVKSALLDSQLTNQLPVFPRFPSLNASVLCTAPNSSTSRKKGDRTRRKDKSIPKSFTIGSEGVGIADATRGSDPTGNSTLLSGPIPARPAVIAQGNWKFVEQLLQECKTKTKRLLVGKMGNEAIELGHGQVSISGVEDNTLIAGLCDLLERVWAHGLQTKQGKSALWSHILHYQELKTAPMATTKPTKASSHAPAYAFVTLRKKLQNLSAVTWDGGESPDGGAISSSGRPALSPADPSAKQAQPNRMKPLPVSLIFDMRNVQNMMDIKTHLGYARAWVRLCLEKKLLFQHLTTLLSEETLLRTLYKRYAFLRCDDERDQFLYYLLSLNAVDYHCFTNTYTNSVITYRVFMANIRQSGMSSCRPYLLLSGSLAGTQPVHFSANRSEVLFQHKNLGILTTLRIGMEDPNGSGRWLMDHILVRNEVTGHTYKFACGRWLGRDIEDGSLERLLVAGSHDSWTGSAGGSATGEGPYSAADPSGHLTGSPTLGVGSGSRARSPNTNREGSSGLTHSLTHLAGNLNLNLSGRTKLSVSDIQRLLGDAVNNLVKYYHRPAGERGAVTLLLCGDLGLVPCLELALQYGFRSSRIFSKNLFLWDYLLRVRELYTQDPRSVTSVQDYGNPRSDRAARTWLCDTIARVHLRCAVLGKCGKLQLFLCLAARDKMLHRIVAPLAACSATATVYEESSFLRETRLRAYLQHILQTLCEFAIVLESSITRGVD